MISNIKYDLKFSNGKTLKQELALKPGSTLITGANGAGKSMNFEMIAFCLFGAKALRGVAGDYKGIKAELTLAINGSTFTIKRTKSKSEVFSETNEPVASGTKPVNQWVLRTLGYNFDVFRIAHWCAQGDIQALADMRPTERKAMVDSVAGLTQMDGLAKDISVQCKELQAEIKGVTSNLREPVKPLEPELDRETATRQLEGANQCLEQWLLAYNTPNPQAPVKPTEPVAPEEPVYPEQPEQMQSSLAVPQPPVIPEGMPGTMEQLTQTEQYLDKQVRDARDVEILYLNLEARVRDVAFPAGWEDVAVVNDAWEKHNRYLRVETLKQNSDIECPHCKGHFHLNAELAELEKLPLEENEPPVTVQQWREIQTQLNTNAEYEDAKAKYEAQNVDDVREALSQVRLLKAEVLKFENANKEYKQHVSQLAKANETQQAGWQRTVDNLKAQYERQYQAYETAVSAFKTAMSDYENRLKQYEADSEKYAGAQEILAELSNAFADPERTEEAIRATIRNASDTVALWQQYDNLKAQYETAVSQYNEAKAGIADKEAKLEELSRARTALGEVKAKVQSHILPSLNRVASGLISEMTGGEMKSVEVGQDFEVTVDGQPLRTLSGSGKDLANLTLRIGLGRILTHRVLPVMMLDEIDSAMDKARAEYTWECVERITPHIGQVLQASHKELDTDSRIEV